MKRVLIAAFGDTGNEPEALRQVLESFGCLVLIQYIGRPNDFISVLIGATPFDPDVVILSCHGEDGRIIMPVLDDSIYAANEPKGNLSSDKISKHLKLTKKTIINTGCTTGSADLVGVFGRDNSYIAPASYIEGNAVLLFMVDFFYQMLQNKYSAYDAWNHAKALDKETAQFVFRSGIT